LILVFDSDFRSLLSTIRNIRLLLALVLYTDQTVSDPIITKPYKV
jgi:hypothetical protein